MVPVEKSLAPGASMRTAPATGAGKEMAKAITAASVSASLIRIA